ncbi:hypothetical protein Tco_1413609 [Tanacetum coccineum]
MATEQSTKTWLAVSIPLSHIGHLEIRVLIYVAVILGSAWCCDRYASTPMIILLCYGPGRGFVSCRMGLLLQVGMHNIVTVACTGSQVDAGAI